MFVFVVMSWPGHGCSPQNPRFKGNHDEVAVVDVDRDEAVDQPAIRVVVGCVASRHGRTSPTTAFGHALKSNFIDPPPALKWGFVDVVWVDQCWARDLGGVPERGWHLGLRYLVTCGLPDVVVVVLAVGTVQPRHGLWALYNTRGQIDLGGCDRWHEM